MTEPADHAASPLPLDRSDRDVADILGLGDDVFDNRTGRGAELAAAKRRRLALVAGATVIVALAGSYGVGALVGGRARPIPAAPPPAAGPAPGPALADVLVTSSPAVPPTATLDGRPSETTVQAATAAADADAGGPEPAAPRRVRRAAAVEVASLPRRPLQTRTPAPFEPAVAAAAPRDDVDPSPQTTIRLAENAKVRPAHDAVSVDAASTLDLTRQEPPGDLKLREDRIDAADAIRLLRRK